MYVGIDLGGTGIKVGLVDESGNILHKDSVPTQAERHYSEIVKDMADLSLKVIQDAGYCENDIKAIGIGCPGTPDKEAGMLVYANNLNFYNVPLRAEFQKYIQLPVYIDNDANCAALAEAVAGSAKDANHSIMITLGTGVGSGIIIDKKIYSGFNDSGGEMGHIVIQMDGEQCTCGRKGCWEAYASATALIRQTKHAAKMNPASLINKLVDGDLSKIDGKTAFDAKRQGDKVAANVISNYIKYLGEGITNVINVFQPEVLVIGGGICKEGPNLTEPLEEWVDIHVYCKDVARTQIRIAVLGNDAGIIGAAMLGKQ